MVLCAVEAHNSGGGWVNSILTSEVPELAWVTIGWLTTYEHADEVCSGDYTRRTSDSLKRCLYHLVRDTIAMSLCAPEEAAGLRVERSVVVRTYLIEENMEAMRSD